MPAKRERFVVSLTAYDYARLAELAARAGMPVPKFAAAQLQALVALEHSEAPPQADAPVEAEKKLFAWLHEHLAELSSWDEEIILRVFQAIERSQLQLYEEASRNGGTQRINRLIGAAIRYHLRTEPKMNGRLRVQRHVRKSECSLIKTFTLLMPPSDS